jgi:ectoine hydroxylase-related dioxygenase (phytanoyl-CoA dioxygenase family)
MSFQLTADQLRQFDEEGYVIVEGLFTDAELQPVCDEINREVEARAEALVREGKLSQTYEEFGFERQLAKISEETDRVALDIWNGSLAGPAFFDLICNPKLLDIGEQFCGPELIASSVYRLRPKVPGHRNGPVPWHQDSGYFEPYCDSSMVLTVWLPLIDATEARGCMWVQPGVHKSGVYRHGHSPRHVYLEIPEDDLPPAQAIPAPVPKGGILLLSNLTPHASFENNSDVVRWSMDLRYQSAALPTNAEITRLPGEISESVEKGIPIACYPPEADFLVRSALRPTEVVTDAERFRSLRQNHRHRSTTVRWE